MVAEHAYPLTAPRSFGGYKLPDNPARVGDIERGFFATAWEYARAYWDMETKERWRALFEESPEIGQEDFEALVGDRDIKRMPFQTEAEVERQIAIHDFEASQQEYESRGLAALVGSSLPLMVDPVGVATLPAGFSNFARSAARGATLRQSMTQATIGGAKVGAASVPLEAAMQMQMYGKIDPLTVAASGVGPVLLSPLLAAAGRGARAVFQRSPDPELAGAAVNSPLRKPGAAPEDAAKAVYNNPDVKPPPVYRRETVPFTPVRRMEDSFAQYEGGASRWVQDMAAKSPRATQFAREQLGFDPDDSTVLRDYLRQVKADSDARVETPPKHNFRTAGEVRQVMRGEELSPGAEANLRASGLAERASPEEPVKLTPMGERLSQAMKEPQVPANRDMLEAYHARGTSAVKAQIVKETGSGDSVRDLPSIVEPPESLDSLMGVLEAAVAEAGTPAPAARPAQPMTGRQTAETAAENAKEAARARKQLKAMGADDEDVRSMARKLMEGLETCRV